MNPTCNVIDHITLKVCYKTFTLKINFSNQLVNLFGVIYKLNNHLLEQKIGEEYDFI